MTKPATIFGFSITPTHVNAVKLSTQTYTVEQQVHKALPPATLSHDTKRILDAPTFMLVIRDIMAELGNPEFSSPVHLSIHTPFLEPEK